MRKAPTCTSDELEIPLCSLFLPLFPVFVHSPSKKITKITSQPVSNQLLCHCCFTRTRKTQFYEVNWQQHTSNIKPIQPNKLTRTSKKVLLTQLHWHMQVESRTAHLNFGKVDEEELVNWHINYWLSVKYPPPSDGHSFDRGQCFQTLWSHTHTHKGGVLYVYNKSRKWLSGELPAVSRDKRRLRKPCGRFPLSGAASLLTWSQSQGVMELEKVINPALQQGQDSSIKPTHKDSSIFNYCFQSAEES